MVGRQEVEGLVAMASAGLSVFGCQWLFEIMVTGNPFVFREIGMTKP